MMSLTTPDNIRTLQRKLYLKAKAEPNFRFYLLYDKIHRADILRHAYDLVRANRGAPGTDGVDFAAIEAAGRTKWLDGIERDLRTKTYQPQPVRRVMIPKPGGGERPLGIPTIRDRVVQTAAKLVLEPIFEADLEPTAYGYRPGRSGIDAVKAVHRLLCQGFTDVVDADLSKYFDTIPHNELLGSVAARIVDRHVLRLIKSWLKAPVEETDPAGAAHAETRVESRMGVVAWAIRHRPVSHPRSSNAACGFPALRSPTGFIRQLSVCIRRNRSTPSFSNTTWCANCRVPREGTL